MTEDIQFHTDSNIDAVLPLWSTTATYLEVHAARRLFDTWDSMAEFFAGAVPRSRLTRQGLMGGGGRRSRTDPGHVLRVLEELDVQRSELPQAAFLIMRTSEFQSARSGHTMSEYRYAKSRGFIDAFSGVSLPDLLKAFYYAPRKNEAATEWIHGCFEQGLPPKYIRHLRHVVLRPQDWPPSRLGEAYRSGVPAEYPALFWDRAAEFWALHESGVPFDYAEALRDS